jgi:hypothetical protein
MHRVAALIAALVLLPQALIACRPAPPPAPEGLDASSAYMIKNFYADDLTFTAGLTGFINWYEDEGYELIDLEATVDNVSESFSVGRLTDDDLSQLPLVHGRDVSLAAGVVSLADMNCPVPESEDYLLRVDQEVVFPDDWETYERSFTNSRADFQAATISGEFVAVDEELGVFESGFDGDPWSSTLLLTENTPDPQPLFGGLADIGEYTLYLDLRHGDYLINDELLRILTIVTYIPDSVSGPQGENHLHQSYSIDVNVQWEGDRTLRMFAVWAEPEGAGLDPDDPIVLNYAVDKSVKSSERLTAVCAGDVEIPDEP